MAAGRARPRRRAELSQHFLRGSALAASLVREANIKSTDLVVEVGAGYGALTQALSQRAGRVIAVEIDRELADALASESTLPPNVEVVNGDALRLPLPDEPFRVVANVPYSITSELIRRLLSASSLLDAHLIVQREAALRYSGMPHAGETLTSLALKPAWHAEVLRSLNRFDFVPPPRVESSVLWLARRSPALLTEVEHQRWLTFLDRGFGRTPTMRGAMRSLFTAEQTKRLARELSISLERRPSETHFDQWLALFRFWQRQRGERFPGRG